jgi:hypothetical protein
MSQIRTLHAQALGIVAEMDRHNVVSDVGYSSLAGYLVDLLRVTPRKATRMVAQAARVTETLTPTGHLTPAPLAVVSAGMAEGVLDGDHLDVIAETLNALPDRVTHVDRDPVESTLVQEARRYAPHVVRAVGKEILTRIDQDGPPPTDESLAEPDNVFRYHRTRTGRMRFTGEIDTEAAEELDGLLSALAKPQPSQPGVPDPRSYPERQGDAFAEIIHLATTSADLPQHGGSTPNLTVTVDYDELAEGVGAATLESGAILPAAAARRIACDAQIIPMVLNADSVPLDLGRTRRLVTLDQRKALVARDKGCAFPGCDRPPRWTDAHHVKHWADGGATDLQNQRSPEWSLVA